VSIFNEAELEALDARLELAFQPIVRLADGAVFGFEALARLNRTRPGWALGEPPGDARAAAFLERLTAVMLRRGAAALAGWRRVWPPAAAWTLSVNAPSLGSVQAWLLAELAAVCSRHDLPASALRLELSEHAALPDLGAAAEAVALCRTAGVGVSLDDFGSGATALRWLAVLPVDGLKLDRWLVQAAAQPRGGAVLRGLLGMARDLGASVVAEGIENEAERALLEAWGCQFGQGFLFAPPLDQEQALAWARAAAA